MTGKAKRPAILIVEDDPISLALATDMVELLGFKPVPASNADLAMAILEHGESIRIVFTDIIMPGRMDGIEFARTVRDRWPNVGILIASGRPSDEFEKLPEESRFLAKPYSLRAVENTLQELLV